MKRSVPLAMIMVFAKSAGSSCELDRPSTPIPQFSAVKSTLEKKSKTVYALTKDEIRITDDPMGRKTLDLSHKDLTGLEGIMEIHGIKKVRRLILNNNRLSSFHLDLPKLEYLYLDNNHLTFFNLRLPNLKVLSLSRNFLTTFEAEFESLKLLYLDNNYLQWFDRKCITLEALWIANNRLKFFHPHLPNLRYLDISNNRIKMIDHLLTDFPFLQRIDLINNPIDHAILASLQQQCGDMVINFYPSGATHASPFG